MAAEWLPANQEVLALTVLWLVRKKNEKMREREREDGNLFPITPAKVPGENLIGPA